MSYDIKLQAVVRLILSILFPLLLFSTSAMAQSLYNDGGVDGRSVQRTCDVFLESGGLVVMETESAALSSHWSLENDVAGASGAGYYEWRKGNLSLSIDPPEQGILSYPVEITEAGVYQFLFRTAAPDKTDHNDVWMRFPDNKVEARKSNGNIVNLGQDTWFKVYQNDGGDKWSFDANTIDNNAHQIFALIDNPGLYRLQLSGRSTQFKMDRLVLFHESVSEASATDPGNAESGCSSLPVTLTSFQGLVNGGTVHLKWTTASELNNAGFDVEFATDAAGRFNKAGFVAGAGTSSESVDYAFTHTPAGLSGQMIYYRLKQFDFDGTFDYSDVIAVNLPAASATLLHAAYPNPFNPVTTLSFTLPAESEVKLTVYDTTGRIVQELIDGVHPAGFHNAPFKAAEDMASGVYIYRLVTPAQTLSGLVMLLK